MTENTFLPLNRKDMEDLGWDSVDFIIVSGDAYVDHPSFGTALIGRVLTAEGFRVAILAQPDWQDIDSFKALGQPNLAFLVTSGNIDSMVNHYTAAKKPRSTDLYSPGGQKGLRPDRATIVYSQKVRQAYKDVPVIIGGIEASLRRFAHYDYWQDKIRRSIIFDAKADLLVYGMGEKQIKQIAQSLYHGTPISEIHNIPGTCYIANDISHLDQHVLLASFEEISQDKIKYAQNFMQQYREQNPILGKAVIEPHGDRYLVQLPPAPPLTPEELDEIFKLPFTRKYHPNYEDQGGIPALKEVEFSIVSHRGCYGGCSFCALNFHQGRIIQHRSRESILEEAKLLVDNPDFKGYIHDVGGPTANFRKPACKFQSKRGACQDRQCLHPEPCPHLDIDHQDYLELLKEVRNIPGVKKVFVRSGLRYDYLTYDPKKNFINELCKHHVSGQLKVAPEHVSSRVLQLMGKPQRQIYDQFTDEYTRANQKNKKQQFLVPYFISSHPGSTLKDAIQLAEYIRDMGYNPEQVQDFIPTPGSLSTTMYYTGLDPRTMRKIYVARSQKEKAMQRSLLQYRDPKNYSLVYEALIKEGRRDLIGYGPRALIKPPKEEKAGVLKKNNRANRNKKGSR